MIKTFPASGGHGHWVAPDVPEFVINPTSVGSDLPPAGFSRSQFRRGFDLAEVPTRVPLRVTADSRYVLWVNGIEVGRGPIRSQPRRLRYDSYDIADQLRPGRNAVAVLVTYYGHPNSFWQPAASSGIMGRDAQLVLEARLGPGLADHRRPVADAAVPGVARAESGQTLEGVPVELLDARELDPDWLNPDFDDSSWPAATLLKATHDGALGESRPPLDPYGAMLPRGIATLGGDWVSPPTVTVQSAAPVSDLPDHPADRLVQQLRTAGDRPGRSAPAHHHPQRATPRRC